ncbi:MAG: HicB family protein [Syntrophus sp. PtaB.Bin138]|nr:MAG: HicB family protein [Syntrophus sp. PtaB.Bin138]
MKSDVSKYTYRIVWSEEDGCHIARCLEFPSLSAHGDTIEDALREIEFVVDETIKWMNEEGEPIPESLGMKKFRGHLTLRVPAEKHRELAIRSAEEGVSVNQFILSRL